MITAIGILIAGMAVLAIIVRQLRKAPEGFEDERGFHVIRNKEEVSSEAREGLAGHAGQQLRTRTATAH